MWKEGVTLSQSYYESSQALTGTTVSRFFNRSDCTDATASPIVPMKVVIILSAPGIGLSQASSRMTIPDMPKTPINSLLSDLSIAFPL